ncbi:MAG: SCP2 sterol-binding domain-containing protein [Acidimicrobiia bacterium]|nr:SCP2 sterol-binding domain-containing protein [Acidimicrobiia bacterium]
MGNLGSERWLQAVLAAAEVLPVVPGCHVTARIEISGGPDGPIRLGAVVADGRLVRLSSGRPADHDCTISCSAADAQGILSGQVDPAVAYMQGRLKIDGAYERVLFGLQPVLGGEEFAAFVVEVAALTGAD